MLWGPHTCCAASSSPWRAADFSFAAAASLRLASPSARVCSSFSAL